MESLNDFQHFFNQGYLDYRPGVTVDCAIFGYLDGKLQVLLVKNIAVTMWCLPGGYVRNDESLSEAATRVTEERTGIQKLFLKQFKTFGKPGRNLEPGAKDLDTIKELLEINIDENSWIAGDTISVGYYSITDIVNSTPKPDFISSECRWFPVDDLPPLGFDHNEIFKAGLSSMRKHLNHFPIGINLLPDNFTLKEIRNFYEVMSGKELDPCSFTNKLIKLGLIVKLDEKKPSGKQRPPRYYRFDDRKYKNALNTGLVLTSQQTDHQLH